MDTNRDRRTTEHEDTVCRTCNGILRWYAPNGHAVAMGRGGFYGHVRTAGPDRGKFFITNHRSNPAARS